MKKTLIILIIIIALVGGGIWLYNSTKTEERPQANNNSSNYESKRSDININNDEHHNISHAPTVIKQEVEIANFSTAIYNKDEERQKNITITSIIVSAIISSLTVGGKAIFKKVAIKNCDNIIFIVGKIKNIFKLK